MGNRGGGKGGSVNPLPTLSHPTSHPVLTHSPPLLCPPPHPGYFPPPHPLILSYCRGIKSRRRPARACMGTHLPYFYLLSLLLILYSHNICHISVASRYLDSKFTVKSLQSRTYKCMCPSDKGKSLIHFDESEKNGAFITHFKGEITSKF